MQTAKTNQPGLFNAMAHPKTYENIWYLLLSFPLGLCYFILLMFGATLGIGLIPVFLGFPILQALFVSSKNILHFERQIAGRMLGYQVNDICTEPPQTQSMWKRFLFELSDANSWSGLVMMLFKFCVGMFSFPLIVALLTTSLALLFSPLLYLLIEQMDLTFTWSGLLTLLAPGVVSPWVEVSIYCAVGVLLLFISLFVLNGLSRFCAYFALALGR